MHEYESSFQLFDFRFYTPTNWYFIVPNVLHTILFYGTPLITLASIGVVLWGIYKKKRKKRLIIWSLVAILSAILVVLTWSNHIVGHYMFGG